MTRPSTQRTANVAARASNSGARRPLLVNGERLRQRVDRPDRGGGPAFNPYSIEENIERLIPQVDVVRTEIADIESALRGDDLIVEARLLPQFLSASAFPNDLFSAAGLVHVGTKNDVADTFNRQGEHLEDRPTKTVYLAVRDNLDTFQAILAQKAGRQTKRTMADICALDFVELSRPLVVTGLGSDADSAALIRDNDGLVLYETVLHGRPTRSGRVATADGDTLAKFLALAEGLGGLVERDFIRSAGTLLFVPVRLAPEVANQAAQFNALRSVQPMARLRPLPHGSRTAKAFTSPVAAGPATSTPLRVALFDCGVDETSPYWQNRVTSPVVGSLVNDVEARRHGAMVTSALLYGHVDSPDLPEPANMDITHYAALPQQGYDDDLGLYWLLDTITDIVRSNDFDVVTICAAPDRVVTDDVVDRWTSTLDNLSHEEGVLFVVAAGNNGDAPDHLGLNRILVPGDATNVLTVGAADAVSPKTGRATYSAVGPGRAGAEIRPSGLAFGGNDAEPFIGVDNDGAPLTGSGTSYAAPLLTHSLADLSTRIGRDRVSPVTLRAFALHFARDCSTKELREIGHGHFADTYEFLLDGPENEAHILYRGTIARAEFVPLSIPVPDSRSGSLAVEYTLVTSTATEASDSVDYTKAGLDVTYRPHANIYSLTKGANTVTVNSMSPEFARYTRQNYQQSGEPKSANIGVRPKTEGQLRAEGKWDSVRLGRHRYNKAEDSLYRPRIELSHLAREGGVLINHTPDLDWALLITLRASKGINLYAQVRAQYSVLTTLPAPTVSVGTRTA